MDSVTIFIHMKMFKSSKNEPLWKKQSRHALLSAPLAALVLFLLLPAVPASAQSGPGYALSFNGVDNCVTVPDHDLLTFTNSFTWEAWINLTKTNWPLYEGWATLFAKDAYGKEYWFAIDSYTGGKIDIRFNSQSYSQESSSSVASQAWQHVAVTWDGSNVRYFLDGQLDRTVAYSLPLMVNTTNVLLIGKDVTAGVDEYHFKGEMDEIRLWNVARSQAEIQAAMHRPLAGSETGLVAYWPFSESSGTVAGNSATASGSACNGTVAGSPAHVLSGVPFIPGVATGSVTGLGLTGATLNATVNPGNLATTTWLEWGATTSYGNSTSSNLLAATNSSLAVSAALTGLTPGQTYHYRVVATNSAGIKSSADAQFRTRDGTGILTNIVTTLADSGAGSLRQAIADSLSGDVIVFATNGTITLTSGELVITNDLTITGPGATHLAVSGNYTSRVFTVSSTNATVSISGLTICNGKAPNGANAGPGGNGGGVYNGGTLTLAACTFSTNAAGAGGNGIDHYINDGGTGGNGGGIFSSGSLTLNACMLSANVAGAGGDAFGGMSGGNGGTGGNGGGIFSSGSLTLYACMLSANVAGAAGHSLVSDPSSSGAGGNGGGIFSSGSLTIDSCTLSANVAGTGGPGCTGYHIAYGTQILNPLNNGDTGGDGGDGGGVYNSGTLTLSACTFSANAAGTGGTGGAGGDSVSSFVGGGDGGAGGAGGDGGGICNSGTLALAACTFSLNAAGAGGVGGTGGNPTSVPIDEPGGNGGTGGIGGSAGGICNRTGAPFAALRNCLVASNGVGAPGSAGVGSPGYPDGLPGGAGFAGSDPDFSGTFTSLGHNLLGIVGTSLGLINNGIHDDLGGSAVAPINPFLGPLADNGGPTMTMALLPGSPALDAGDDTLTGTDQRGFPRKSGAHVDIGAFELDGSGFSAPAVAPATGTVTNLGTGCSGADLGVTVNPNGINGAVYIQYGFTTNYGFTTTPVSIGYGTNAVATNLSLTGLAPGLTYHYRVVAQSLAGTTYGPDQTLTTAAFFAPGDANGNGVVEQSELNAVYTGYWQDNPTEVTNALGLGTTTVQLGLDGTFGWDLAVQASTNLITWTNLPGSVRPVFQFTDSSATNSPQRFYRLLAP